MKVNFRVLQLVLGFPRQEPHDQQQAVYDNRGYVPGEPQTTCNVVFPQDYQGIQPDQDSLPSYSEAVKMPSYVPTGRAAVQNPPAESGQESNKPENQMRIQI